MSKYKRPISDQRVLVLSGRTLVRTNSRDLEMPICIAVRTGEWAAVHSGSAPRLASHNSSLRNVWAGRREDKAPRWWATSKWTALLPNKAHSKVQQKGKQAGFTGKMLTILPFQLKLHRMKDLAFLCLPEEAEPQTVCPRLTSHFWSVHPTVSRLSPSNTNKQNKLLSQWNFSYYRVYIRRQLSEQ